MSTQLLKYPGNAERLDTSSLIRLPNELLLEIAGYLPDRHPDLGYVIESANLASLSSVSRKLRAITLPLLFREVSIISEDRFRQLDGVPSQLLKHLR